MATVLAGKKGPLVLVEPGNTVYSIAADIAGNPDLWPELVDVNPSKKITPNGTFQTMVPGERLAIPLTWLSFAKKKGVRPVAEDAMGIGGDAGAVLPLGWTDGDVEIVNKLAELWGASGDDLLVTWYEESGLKPHLVVRLGDPAPDSMPTYTYAGLIMGLSDVWDKGKNRRVYVIDESLGWPQGTWLKIVQQTPVGTQLQAIAQIWDRLFKTYLRSESIRSFANRMSVSVAAVIHALNFLPAYVAGLRSSESAITQSPNIFYTSNKGLDVNSDGKITLDDLDAHGRAKLAELVRSNLGQIVATSRALAKQGETESLAALFAPISNQWLSLTGRAPVVQVGYKPSERNGNGGGFFVLVLAVVGGVLVYKYAKKR